MKKIVLLAFVFVFLSPAVFVGFTRPAVAQETIYIRADGSVEGTDKIHHDGNVYTLTDNIVNQSIVVKRDNIVVDGAGYTLQGAGDPTFKGIDLTGRSHVTIKNIEIKAFGEGIWLSESPNNNISGNNIASNDHGIWLGWSSNNAIFGNNITNNVDRGIMLEFDSNYNSISRNTITNNGYGIQLFISSNNNSISGNDITNNFYGILLREASYNSISGNSIIDSRFGIWLENSSSYNSISGNTITNNYQGVWFRESPYNKIYCNNFIDNTVQVIFPVPINTWDDGYPSGGNYWSNYAGVDSHSGAHQNETGRDGIGDTAHNIYPNNTDNYPLMGMFRDFSATSEYHVQTICNSSISDFQFNGTAISFNVSGENGTAGFCRICVPTALMNGTYKVFVNSAEIPHTLLPCSNSIYSYLYFTYNHSTQEVTITTEFTLEEEEGVVPFWMQWWFWTIIIAGIAVLAAAVYFLKKRKPPTQTAPV